jgi:hypothetical protein
MSDNHDNFLKGNIFLELTKALLEKAGYQVVPYGYEKTLNVAKRHIAKTHTITADKIRSSPDLLVYEENGDAKLVEVKMSSYAKPRLNQRQLKRYRTYWDDAFIVIVLPTENVFYSQKIDNLALKEDDEQYDPNVDFKKIQSVFKKINSIDLEYYGGIAKNLFEAMNRKKNIDLERQFEDLEAY